VLPSVLLSNIILQETAKRLNINNFRDVFLRDELPGRPRANECGMLKLDDSSGIGTHWMGWIKRGYYNLERGGSQSGFVVSASSICSEGYRAYGAFNNCVDSRGSNAWATSVALGLTAWLTIECPEPVIIWRIALTALCTLNSWCLSASNGGSAFINILTSNEMLEGIFPDRAVPNFFVLPKKEVESSITAYHSNQQGMRP